MGIGWDGRMRKRGGHWMGWEDEEGRWALDGLGG